MLLPASLVREPAQAGCHCTDDHVAAADSPLKRAARCLLQPRGQVTWPKRSTCTRAQVHRKSCFCTSRRTALGLAAVPLLALPPDLARPQVRGGCRLAACGPRRLASPGAVGSRAEGQPRQLLFPATPRKAVFSTVLAAFLGGMPSQQGTMSQRWPPTRAVAGATCRPRASPA